MWRHHLDQEGFSVGTQYHQTPEAKAHIASGAGTEASHGRT